MPGRFPRSSFAVFISSISDVVDKKARAVLHDAKQIFKSGPLNANLWGRVERRFENCLKDMSKNVHVDVDEDTLKRRIQTLIAYVDLLQDSWKKICLR